MRPHELPGAGGASQVTALAVPRQMARMRRHAPSFALILTSLLLLDGCEVVKGIFKAGVGVGVAGVLFLVVAIGGIAAMVSKK